MLGVNNLNPRIHPDTYKNMTEDERLNVAFDALKGQLNGLVSQLDLGMASKLKLANALQQLTVGEVKEHLEKTEREREQMNAISNDIDAWDTWNTVK